MRETACACAGDKDCRVDILETPAGIMPCSTCPGCGASIEVPVPPQKPKD